MIDTMRKAPDSLLVICDSLSYFGPSGGLPSNDPRIWPNILARKLRTHAHLIGRIGWTSRDAYWAVTKDPNIWAILPEVSAVIIAVGGMDTLPSPIPTALRETIRYIRPTWLRDKIRSSYNFVQPFFSRLGWPQALPANLTMDYLEKIHVAITSLRPDIPVILLGISSHGAPAYSSVHNGYAKILGPMLEWTEAKSIPYIHIHSIVDKYIQLAQKKKLTSEDLLGDREDLYMNPDGIHWGFELHHEVAVQAYKVISQVLEEKRSEEIATGRESQ